jgi:hypothetical protein
MCLLFWCLYFGSPTSRATLEHMSMMKETVERVGRSSFPREMRAS